MDKMQDQCFIRIIPNGLGQALISTFISDPRELREELKCLSYELYQSLNVFNDHLFVIYDRTTSEVQVHSVYSEDKQFLYDVVIHGFDSTYELIDFLCSIAGGKLSRHVLN
ncbi:MAG: hypothetical protein IKP28_04775 [Clostridia bacterium]|nr:hypothetical protein [Clostridia bacterium]